MSPQRALVAAALLAAFVACGDISLDPLPLQITVEASRVTASTSDSISFLVVTQGGSLVGIEMDYGDGSGDMFSTGGARTVTVSFRHAYATTGAFQVSATVTDASAGQKSAGLQVQIQ